MDGGDMGIEPGFEAFEAPYDGNIGIYRIRGKYHSDGGIPERALRILRSKGWKFYGGERDFFKEPNLPIFPLYTRNGGLTGEWVAYMLVPR
jgi:hypothetical protein